MRTLYHLFLHEVRMLWIAPATYIAAVLFLVLMGFIYVFYLYYATTSARETLPVEWFFQSFYWPVFFLVPLLTMKSIAEEKHLGTLEALMTAPIRPWQIVFSKYLAVYCFYLALWALTLGFPVITDLVQPSLAKEAELFNAANLWGGYTFVALSGTLYIAVGVFTSSLTRSQLIAGILCFSMLFLIIVSGQILMRLPIEDYGLYTWVGGAIEHIKTFQHLEDFSRGVLDVRPMVLYISGAFLFIGLTSLVVEAEG